jgi:hypothetical protein
MMSKSVGSLRIRLMSAMPSAAIPNLYLKWRAIGEIAGDLPAGKQIFHDLGPDEAAQKLSRMLHGDVGCSADAAARLADVVNSRIEHYCTTRSVEPAFELNGSDFGLPLFSFVRRVIEAAKSVQPETLDRIHAVLLSELRPSQHGKYQLVVERITRHRSFDPFIKSGGPGPLIFEPSEHKGELAITGVSKAPIAAYTFLAHDPAPKRLWDQEWGETVEWLPSPIKPALSDGRLLLMPPSPVKPKPGRFIVTAVLGWSKDAVEELDPAGRVTNARALDERETARFLINMRRMTSDARGKWAGTVSVTTAEYLVK